MVGAEKHAASLGGSRSSRCLPACLPSLPQHPRREAAGTAQPPGVPKVREFAESVRGGEQLCRGSARVALDLLSCLGGIAGGGGAERVGVPVGSAHPGIFIPGPLPYINQPPCGGLEPSSAPTPSHTREVWRGSGSTWREGRPALWEGFSKRGIHLESRARGRWVVVDGSWFGPYPSQKVQRGGVSSTSHRGFPVWPPPTALN